MPATQAERANAFAALHSGSSLFIMPNPWDAGSAKLLASLGYKALATSSGAQAGVLGRRDGRVSRAEAMAHARLIVDSVDLPVSADLEKGFGDSPSDAADTIAEAGRIGLVGGSIEDASGNQSAPIYEFDHAVARITAAVAAARRHPFPFVLTARAENFVRGVTDLNDTIWRLRAFEAAGADVLMAPGLPDLDAVRAVCASLTRPFNFMAGIKGKSFAVNELSQAGVRRVSLATSLYRTAMTAAVEAAREVMTSGTFAYLDRTMSTPELNAVLEG